MTTTALIHPGEAQHAKRVLVINVTRIGDTLLATPALRAIAKYFPNAAITCLGHPKRVEVLKNISYLAKIGGITKNQAPFRGRLGSSRYDWAFVWGPDRPLYEYALRKATRVVGFRQNGAELDARLFHPQPEPPQNSRHAVAWYLALPESIGIPNDGYALDYALSDEERLWAKQRIAADIGRERPLVGLQVASFPTKAYRDWPIEHFVKVTKRIVNARPDARFVLFGSAGDRARALQFAHELPDRTSIYAGQLSLRETVAIMSEIDLYIGVDTGPTHLYGALRKSM
ncbi:MAG: glycosyltransferase family 9 protein, partial [Betaproteobacteria bacterium]|nr:glycosyltransferase family 9 protein [Betaproteobacteria bacterium]